jgi:hypothetical protein
MKTLLHILFAILSANNAGAQLTAAIVKDGKEITMRADTSERITSFTAKIILDNTYLKWSVAGLKNDGVFVVYHSSDGINYSLIGNKTATGVPIKNDIDYYFNCKVSNTKDNYYKIVYVSKQYSEFIASDKIYVCDEKAVCCR